MAHANPGRRLLVAALLASTASPSFALGLGEAELRSALGEPLDLVIAITTSPEDALGPDCFYLPRPLSGGLPAVANARFTIESGPRLRVRTPQPLNEPAMVLRLHGSCPGGGLVARDYPLLLDLRPLTAVASPAPAQASPSPRASSATAASDSGAAGLVAIPGDTLQGIGTAIYPKNRRARDAYIAAIRESNPALAGLGADEPIPPGTGVQLPDLKAFAQRTAPAKAEPATVTAEPATRAPKAMQEKSARAPAAAPPERKPSPPAARDRTRRPDGFVLRLSSSEMDLSPSRQIDDRTRAQLRERLMLLDADDQVAALLQLRSSLKQLENRVTEMQLRLSGTLPTAPAAAPSKAPVSEPTTPAPASVAAKAPAAPEPVKAPEVKATATPKPSEPAAPAPAPEPPPAPAIPLEAWGLVALALAGLALFAWMVVRRRSRPRVAPVAAPASEFTTVMGAARHSSAAPTEESLAAPDSPEHAGRLEAASDAQLTTRIPGADPEILRRRYLDERFPEIADGTLEVANPDSIVKGARLFYEDGALPRAVELLQFAIEEDPKAMKPWLALFEIFRLENLAGEFGALAARFREHHGASENWRKVQFIGRAMDPENSLYREEAFESLETIGYPDAARTSAIAFDPLAENWLNAPMDFTSDALAAEFRRSVLADAGLGEPDLVPNPTPALKQVEMFNIA